MNPYEPPKGDIEPPEEPEARDYTLIAVTIAATVLAGQRGFENEPLQAAIIGIFAGVLWVWRTKQRKG